MGAVVLSEAAPVVAVDPKATGRKWRSAYLVGLAVATVAIALTRARSGRRHPDPAVPPTDAAPTDALPREAPGPVAGDRSGVAVSGPVGADRTH